MGSAPPAGYVRVTVGHSDAIVLAEHVDDARALLRDGTLYEAAARDLGARPLQGRGTAYAIALPVSGAQVVVRHNRHGGLLAPLTRDLFLPPTRAPYELDVALRLKSLGVRTPEVVMIGTAAGAVVFRRADVVTREIARGRDLGSYLASDEMPRARAEAWVATRALVRAMNEAGVRHHDLNVKNVLLAREGETLVAHLLDVDRVTFDVPGSASVRDGNVQRLLRSARKWRDERGAAFDERELSGWT
jgi:hypothetical protein